MDQLVRRERPPELLPVQCVLPRRVPAGLGRTERAPCDAIASLVEAAERTFEPLTFGNRFSSGTKTSSMTISPVTDARRLNLPSIFGADRPFIPFSRRNPRMSPSSSFAQTTNRSAIGALVIHIFEPCSTYPSAILRARVC